MFAETYEIHAIDRAKNLEKEPHPVRQRVRIWKVTGLEVEEVELQTKVVRESLVPYGQAVDE